MDKSSGHTFSPLPRACRDTPAQHNKFGGWRIAVAAPGTKPETPRCLPNKHQEGLMKKIVALFALAASLGFASVAKADPYRWCAEYGNFGGGGTNCYFMTLGQCQAAISGN